jgi:uncharacterized protein (DUF433 family)
MTHLRITVDSRVMDGAPCIRGLAIPVSTVVAMVSDGMTPKEIRAQLPELSKRDVVAALRFWSAQIRERGGLFGRVTARTSRPGTTVVRQGVAIPERRW